MSDSYYLGVDDGIEQGYKSGYQQGREDAIEEIEKIMHEAYKGTSQKWECMVFELAIKRLKGEQNE